jgi:subtilisin family serine protease
MKVFLKLAAVAATAVLVFSGVSQAIAGQSVPTLVADNSPKSNYIIRYTDTAPVASEEDDLKTAKVAVGRKFSRVFKGVVASLSAKQVSDLRKRGNVASIELDGPVKASTTETGATWGIDRIDQASLPLSTTYNYTNTGAGVTAYVIDTGIRATHQDFAGRVATGYTAISDGNGTNDCNGHGTHVSGTIAGTTYGVAKAATLVPVRVLDCTGSGTMSGVIAGIDWVASNYVAGTKAVANLSLGGGANSTLDAAISNLISRGVTVVVAAGNSTADACTSSPARVPAAIAVAASDSRDAFATFSNFGSCVDLEAPGVSITSDWLTSDTATATLSGTSMASPHVAGVVAALLSTGYRLPADVATSLLGDTTQSAVTATPAGTANRLLFSNPAGWAPVSNPSPTATATPTSAPSATATPTASPTPTPTPTPTATVPSPATNVTATAGSKSASVRWTLGSNGGSPLTGQIIKVWSGSNLLASLSTAASATSVTVTGLRQNNFYQFSIVEINALGRSADSAKSNQVKLTK